MPQNNVDPSKFLARPVVIIAAASRSSAIQDPADKLYGPFRRAAMLPDDLGAGITDPVPFVTVHQPVECRPRKLVPVGHYL